MTPAQKLTISLEKTKARLNEISGLEGDAYTDEIRSEETTLQTELKDTVRRLETAMITEDTGKTEQRTDSPEGKELQGLIDGASLGAIFETTLEHRSTDGREAELQQHLGLNLNQAPLALLRQLGIEHRAVTPAPANVGTEMDPPIPGVFPMACGAWLGVYMPTVAVGDATFPVLTTNATVHTPAENAAATETTGAFSAELLAPSRLQAAFFFSREDRARFKNMDEALRMNLSDALSDGLDKEIISGTNGLLTGTNLPNNNVSAITAFADYISDFCYSRVDGKYAAMTDDLKILFGNETFAHAGSLYRSNNADYNVIDALKRMTDGAVKVSAHVPALSSSNKQNGVIRLGMRRDMVSPIWEGITLIPDEVTKAASGQIVVTAIMLHAVKIIRADGFFKQQVQTA